MAVLLLAMVPSLQGLVSFLPGVHDGVRAAGPVALARPGAPALLERESRIRSWIPVALEQRFRRVRIQLMSLQAEALHGFDLDVGARRLLNAPVPPSERDFLINGWRWHSRGVIRDVARLGTVAAATLDAATDAVATATRQQRNRGKANAKKGGGADGSAREDGPPAAAAAAAAAEEAAAAKEELLDGARRLQRAYDFAWTFSYSKLMRVESELFFPWLREQLPAETGPVLDGFEQDRQQIRTLGARLGQACAATDGPRGATALLRAVDLSAELQQRVASLVRAQEAYILPYVAAYVTPKAQRRFNTKVRSSCSLFFLCVCFPLEFAPFAPFARIAPFALLASSSSYRSASFSFRCVVRTHSLCLALPTFNSIFASSLGHANLFSSSVGSWHCIFPLTLDARLAAPPGADRPAGADGGESGASGLAGAAGVDVRLHSGQPRRVH
ncbi:unnamed protein product, partial [Phaeothamnion confervicola]